MGEAKCEAGIPSLISSRPASYAPVLGALGPWRDGEQGWQVDVRGGGYVYLCCGYFVAGIRIYLESPRWPPAPSGRAQGPPLTAWILKGVLASPVGWPSCSKDGLLLSPQDLAS